MRRLLFWVLVIVLIILIVGVFGRFALGLHIGRHHGSASVGVGGSTATLGVSGGHTQTVTTSSGTVIETGPGSSSNTNSSSTSVQVDNNPWPGPQNGYTPNANGTYPIDGQIHVFVDLNDVVHDGEDAAFSFTAVNGTGRTIRFSRATLALALDGTRYLQVPVTDLSGSFDYSDSLGLWVATGSLAPGQRIDFQGKVPVPNRVDTRRLDAALACLQGDLQVVYVGKPNATAKADNFSAPSCSQFNAS